MLSNVRSAARGGRRRRVGSSSAVRRESRSGPLTAEVIHHLGFAKSIWSSWRDVGWGLVHPDSPLVDVTTGWTECLPLIVREGMLVVQAIQRAQSLFP